MGKRNFEKIMAAVTGLQKAWLRDGDRERAQEFANKLNKLDWKAIFQRGSFHGIKCRAILLELEGKLAKAKVQYLAALGCITMLRREFEENPHSDPNHCPELEGCKDEDVSQIAHKLQQLAEQD